MDNKEVYFQSLINYYSHHFLYGQEKTLFDFNFMYPIIKRYLNEIKKKDKFSQEEKNLFLIVFLSPIISKNCNILKKHYSKEIKDRLFGYEQKDRLLYIKNINNNVIFTINDENMINKGIFESEMRFCFIWKKFQKQMRI